MNYGQAVGLGQSYMGLGGSSASSSAIGPLTQACRDLMAQQLQAAIIDPSPYINYKPLPDPNRLTAREFLGRSTTTTPTPEDNMAITKEQRPQGWKAALVVLAAAVIAFKLWKNRDEIFVNLEKLASDVGNKLGIGDLPTDQPTK